jgi:ferredoxin
MSGVMRVSADVGVCIGAGTCALTAPSVFGVDDDEGTVTVLQADVSGDDATAAQEAADVCPSLALVVEPVR